jgi:hypothetical protein
LPSRTASLLAPFAAALVASWFLARLLLPTDHGGDMEAYERYGDALIDGRVPYRDVDIEYPPLAVLLFTLARGLSLAAGSFAFWFQAMLLVCALLLLAATRSALATIGASLGRSMLVLGGVALAPLLAGRIIEERYDLLPAALVAVSMAAQLAGRERQSGVALGLATAAKLYPAVLLPLYLLLVAKRSGRRAAARFGVAWAAPVVVVWAPFLALADSDALLPIRWQIERPLQLESVGAALLQAAHQVGLVELGVEVTYGSTNLGGDGPRVAAALVSVTGLALVAALLAVAARSVATPMVTVRATAAVLATLVVCSKVLSTQFLVWLVPAVLLAGGTTGAIASALLVPAAIATNALYPTRYPDLELLEAGATWLLVGRDALLVALAGCLVVPPLLARRLSSD